MKNASPLGIAGEALLLAVLSLVLAGGVNMFRPHPLPYVQDWSATIRERYADREFVDLAEAQRLWLTGEALFVDARDAGSYAQGHIPGALHLPFDAFDPDMATRLSALPEDRLLVVYCSSISCGLSHEMAQNLDFLGYDKVVVLAEGFVGWQSLDAPVEQGPAAGGEVSP